MDSERNSSKFLDNNGLAKVDNNSLRGQEIGVDDPFHRRTATALEYRIVRDPDQCGIVGVAHLFLDASVRDGGYSALLHDPDGKEMGSKAFLNAFC